jgi:hypothetical protein
VLLGQNVFYPYSPPVSADLQNRLDAATAAAARAHFPIKVALIGSPVDLGVVPSLFGQPQKYAEFLDQEISFHGKQQLLVVMPSGYGVEGLPAAATRAASSLAKPAGPSTNELAQAALDAIGKLAAAAGDQIATAGGGAGSGGAQSGGGGAGTLVAIALAVVAVAVAVGVTAARRRRATIRGGVRQARQPRR